MGLNLPQHSPIQELDLPSEQLLPAEPSHSEPSPLSTPTLISETLPPDHSSVSTPTLPPTSVLSPTPPSSSISHDSEEQEEVEGELPDAFC